MIQNFKIVKGDNIYVSIKKQYKKDLGFPFNGKYVPLDDLIENINFLNSYGNHLDISLVNTFTLRLFDSESKETIAEYDLDFDLYNSVGEYCWSRIKL